jgi:hypothetical protein
MLTSYKVVEKELRRIVEEYEQRENYGGEVRETLFLEGERA